MPQVLSVIVRDLNVVRVSVFEPASPEEIKSRLHEEVYITRLDVTVG